MRLDATVRGARRALTLGSFLVIASVAPAPAAPAASTPPAAREAGSFVVGTVRAVNARARTLEVITGVGHAFRLVRMHVARDCEIKDAGSVAQLGSLKRARVVRVRYRIAAPVREGAVQRVAVAIEGLPIEGTGGTR